MALAPFIAAPTQRVALLMAEIERTEHGDSGRRAGLDLARGARAARSGLDRGRLCQRSLAAGLAGHRAAGCLPVADAGRRTAVRQGWRDRILAFEEAMLATPRRAVVLEPPKDVSRTGRRADRAVRPLLQRLRRPPSRTMRRRRLPPLRRPPPRRPAPRSRSPRQRQPRPSRPNRRQASRPRCSARGRISRRPFRPRFRP